MTILCICMPAKVSPREAICRCSEPICGRAGARCICARPYQNHMTLQPLQPEPKKGVLEHWGCYIIPVVLPCYGHTRCNHKPLIVLPCYGHTSCNHKPLIALPCYGHTNCNHKPLIVLPCYGHTNCNQTPVALPVAFCHVMATIFNLLPCYGKSIGWVAILWSCFILVVLETNGHTKLHT